MNIYIYIHIYTYIYIYICSNASFNNGIYYNVPSILFILGMGMGTVTGLNPNGTPKVMPSYG